MIIPISHIPFFSKRKEEEPAVCVACNTTITVKHISIECADLAETRKNFFLCVCVERSLFLLFRNVNLEKMFDNVKEICKLCKV